MEWISSLLAAPSTVGCLIAALVAVALVSTVVFRSIVRKSKLPLKKATVIIEEAKTKEDFAEKYLTLVDQVSAVFQDHRTLKQQWAKFQSQLTRNEAGLVCTYFQPEEFFNAVVLLRSRWLPLCRAVPNYLVGIGLVFTFLGIAVVIYRASLALGTSGDLQALRQLLGAASLKFWTSLVGVALSIATSGYTRHLMARYNVTVADFSHALSQRVFFLSQEYSLHLASSLQAQQLVALQSLRTLIDQSGKETSKEIVSELRGLREAMQTVTEDTFSELVQKSTAELSSAISASLQNTAQTFSTINENLKLIAAQVEPLPESFKSVSEQVAKASSEMTSQLESAGRHFNDDLGKARVSTSQIASEFLTSSDHASRISMALATVPDALAKVTASLAGLSQLESVSQRLHEAAAAVRSSSDALLVNWKQQAEHVSNVDAKLANTVATLPTLFGQYSDSLRMFSEEFEKHLGRVLGALASQVESLESSQNDLRMIAESLHASSRANVEERTAETL